MYPYMGGWITRAQAQRIWKSIRVERGQRKMPFAQWLKILWTLYRLQQSDPGGDIVIR